MQIFKRFIKFFEPPSAEILAQLEFEEAKRQFLVYKAAEEQARHLTAYYMEKIQRLENYIKCNH